MSFYEQLEMLCKRNGEKPTNVVEALGMSRGTMSNWKKGGTPSGDAVVRFAKYFGVTTDFLLLGDTSHSKDLSEEDAEWLSLIHRLPLNAQIEFRGELKGYIKCMEGETVSGENKKQAK